MNVERIQNQLLRSREFLLVAVLVVLAAVASQAQRQDLMSQLMMSQPPVDLSSPVVVTAVVDPPVVSAGEVAVYRITLNALEASVRWPPELYVPTGLSMRQSAGGQLLTLVAGVQKPITARNFHIRSERPGFYSLPAFEIEAYGKRVVVPETQFEVLAGRPAGYEPARRIHLQIARTNVFVGETIPVTVMVPGSISNVVSGLSQVQFNGEAVHGSKVPTRQLVEQREFNGRRVPTVIYESTITPIAAGPLELSAQGFTSVLYFSGPVVLQGQVDIQGFAADNTLLDSEPVRLNVQSLPSITDAQGFTGFIGTPQVDPPQTSTNALRVGDALRLLITFRGDPSVGRLIPPPPPRVEGWQIYPASPTEPPAGPPATNTVAAFAYTLIPTTEEVKHTPAIQFHAFDPTRATYVNLTIPPVPITVSAEGLPTNWVSELAALQADERVDKRPRLSELTSVRGKTLASMQPLQSHFGFLLVQFAPVAGLLAWWGIARRQRYLEAHPEIVRRRRAKRALHRERRVLQRAAADRDATGFSRSAVIALQIAAAPHFPAEPRALVCSDVLGLFNEEEQRGQTGQTIRHLFAHSDQTDFSTGQHNGHTLFGLKAELNLILNRMEARL